jgi:hypothetical protein
MLSREHRARWLPNLRMHPTGREGAELVVGGRLFKCAVEEVCAGASAVRKAMAGISGTVGLTSL